MGFSVVIPTFNSAPLIARALDSIRHATNSNDFEVIVVDDCSADVAVLEKLLRVRPEVRLVKKTERGNAAESRNVGFEQSQASYVFFLDSDDEFLPGSIDRRIDLHRSSNAGLIFGNFVVIQDGRERQSALPSYSIGDMRDYLFSYSGDFRSSTLSISKVEFGGAVFDPQSYKHQDWIFGIRCGDAREKIEFDPEPSAIIHVGHELQMSNHQNIDASRYFCSNYLEQQPHVNAFARSHWIETILQGDIRAAEFFCRIYKAQSTRERLDRCIYKVLGSSAIIRVARPLTMGALRVNRLLRSILR